MDDKLQAVWTQQIYDRLKQVLRNSIFTGTCLQEFMMLGRSPDTLKPTLVINCGNASIRRQVEKILKTQGWLQELLKSNHLQCVTLEVKLSPSSRISQCTTVAQVESNSVQVQPSAARTSCGSTVLISGQNGILQHCTLGGLLLVNGKIMGLTAGHPFQDFHHNALADQAQVAEDLDEDESSKNCNEPFIFNEDDDNTLDVSGTSSASLDMNVESSPASANGSPHDYNESTALSSLPVDLQQPNADTPSSPSRVLTPFNQIPFNDNDWALLEALPFDVESRPNNIEYLDSRHDIHINGIASTGVCGEVIIGIRGNSPQLGYLCSSPAAMKMGKSILDVRLITLEHVLPLGNSGAWVTLGDRLCGYIIAVRQDVPWAYMVPIEPVLEDIKREFGTDDVRLPAATESESIAVASKSANEPIPRRLGDVDRPSELPAYLNAPELPTPNQNTDLTPDAPIFNSRLVTSSPGGLLYPKKKRLDE
ncbi:MAG: hypothetical protein Q9213_000206 [Squamulea squamosa]